MQLAIDLKKSLQQNADLYYQKSKKAKKKLAGLSKAIPLIEGKIAEAEEKNALKAESREITRKKKRQWFERFHWFRTSDGLLVVAGRDAGSNEALVKKHMEDGDLYFHAEIFGAPHTILKTEKNSAPKKSLEEASVFAAVFSRAWKQKLATADVYSVMPEQVSKKAPAGEALGAGAFMIYGKRNWFRKTKLEFAIGAMKENGEWKVISGPLSAVKKNSAFFFKVEQGQQSKGETAKQLRKLFEEKAGAKNVFELDEIISMLPNGDLTVQME
ncbi:MAG: hypothetical protein QT03_C0001G1238 [archaeon GW2011_AR10]|uniref:DUF814 domain-containing protein n=1 Tax=Candidatus Iainarchaeum sp. TaxID=3101447 RepID=A0A7J4IV89_9ARCH|nr:MAG: hypothetical protein QT03_C0001G1238 [archaeon GW2011_AR10]HIH08145.1 DUF814 domain-containing protein [Candidatus Diapherotrites archaeon]